ncbi:hypothetical protein Kpol_1054p41 [Vanderwaltozyma polyspora DSM 70294]|uniref:HPt domain-containing protein n=1 Tax=Vanderwaltozyma polyspora (strain ATCC 22028 / DSM 70294 / BCRC 21397 / CBS 2163 / NBRC 10782 / NRRL Y-8283 / UCD 57-17) TaxID=436907 RepID=A7TIC8_VANPO|nr:uncharacterized protein Kpol_1054p41 [Vanderwaltozyma polyspora DSM 70294]EDO17994.1 hypothetical protein Kpol_1054p41 [Vanderwaltozyma polyspora DSM 70294]
MSIPKEVIDWNILNEIISMDEDDPDFSRMLIMQYIDQAQTTFDKMQNELETTKDLSALNSLGHFLKGSSATLGLQRIAWICEKIQNLGKKQSNEVIPAIDGSNDKVYLEMISKALDQARVEFKLARKELSDYYKTEL